MIGRRLTRIVAALLAPILFLTLGAPLAAQAQDHAESRSYDLGEGDIPLEDLVGQAIPEDLAEEFQDVDLQDIELPPGATDALPPEAVDAPEGALPEGAEAAALPTGEAKSAVTPNRISLPNAEGSVEGMGESFAPVATSPTTRSSSTSSAFAMCSSRRSSGSVSTCSSSTATRSRSRF